MSNKRIDLTQFEGIGDWEGIISSCYDSVFTISLEEANTITKLPTLIAELKRCYEEIDRLLETIGSWGYVMCPRSNEWFEWDYGCQSEICASHDDDCRELVEASQ
jgi:hypothetical protein